jgi:hypothetical protein
LPAVELKCYLCFTLLGASLLLDNSKLLGGYPACACYARFALTFHDAMWPAFWPLFLHLFTNKSAGAMPCVVDAAITKRMLQSLCS